MGNVTSSKNVIKKPTQHALSVTLVENGTQLHEIFKEQTASRKGLTHPTTTVCQRIGEARRCCGRQPEEKSEKMGINDCTRVMKSLDGN